VRPKTYFVYILCSRPRGATYIGVTNDLERRVIEHRSGDGSKFTKRWNIKHLVYFESFDDVNDAIEREKVLKKWRRNWKFELIEKHNPDWIDLFENPDFDMIDYIY